MLKNKIFASLIIALFLVTVSCSEDEVEMPPGQGGIDCSGASISYANDILPIINTACALSGCHVSGFSNGDFTTYSGLKDKADSGRLESRVVIAKSMPPSNSSGPKTLSENQIRAFKCWIDDGAPDN